MITSIKRRSQALVAATWLFSLLCCSTAHSEPLSFTRSFDSVGFGSSIIAQSTYLDDAAADRAIEESLNKRSRFGWYEDGQVRPIEVAGEGSLPQPQYDWTWKQRNRRNNTTTPGGGGGTGTPGEMTWLSEAMRSFIWILLAVGLALLVYFWLTRVARQQLDGSGRRGDENLPRREVDLIEHLPFQVAAPKSDLLAEAKRLYEAGEFNRAIVYLYSHQLIQLDRHEKIRLTKGKTNRQYLLELRRESTLRDILSQTVLAFEDAFFGRHDIDSERFGRCWSELDRFSNILTDSTNPARS